MKILGDLLLEFSGCYTTPSEICIIFYIDQHNDIWQRCKRSNRIEKSNREFYEYIQRIAIESTHKTNGG